MHPKYWKRPRICAPLDSEGSAGAGGESLVDAFAAHFEGSSAADDDQQQAAATANAAESQDDVAARLAAEDAAAEAAKDGAAEKPEANNAGADDPEKFTVKVDGKDITLTADEMAEHVKNGMRQADYSRKTAEVADVRKTADSEIAQARAQREEYATKLGEFSSQANYELNALKALLTDDLLQSDPVQYLQIQRTAETRQAQLQQAHQELQKVNDLRQQEQSDALKSHMQAQHQALLDKLPAWKDPAKAEAESAQIKKFLADQGFKPEEMQFSDHRAILITRKAMQYDALMARAKDTQGKVEKAPPKVARPGSPTVAPTDGRTKAMRELAATGSRDAAAQVFADMFGGP
jgi:hypothetical protein